MDSIFISQQLGKQVVSCIVSLSAVLAFGACASGDEKLSRSQISPVAHPWHDGELWRLGPFTSVSGVVEVRGQIVIADVKERRISAFSRNAGPPTNVGRLGNGPGELPRVGVVVGWRADSIVNLPGVPYHQVQMLSVSSGRGRSASIGRPIEPSESFANVSFGALLRFWYADSLGNVYVTHSAPLPSDDGRQRFPIYRVSASDAEPVMRAVASLPVPSVSGRTATPQEGLSPLPLGRFGGQSGWTVLRDGRLILVDGETYQITVIAPGGGDTIASFSVPYETVPTSDVVWGEYVSVMQQRAVETAKRSGPPGRAVGYAVPRRPAYLPPVTMSGGERRVLHSGECVWVPVNAEQADSVQWWDLVSLKSKSRLQRSPLRKDEKLVMATDSSVYFLTSDADDFLYLDRYELDVPSECKRLGNPEIVEH